MPSETPSSNFSALHAAIDKLSVSSLCKLLLHLESNTSIPTPILPTNTLPNLVSLDLTTKSPHYLIRLLASQLDYADTSTSEICSMILSLPQTHDSDELEVKLYIIALDKIAADPRLEERAKVFLDQEIGEDWDECWEDARECLSLESSASADSSKMFSVGGVKFEENYGKEEEAGGKSEGQEFKEEEDDKVTIVECNETSWEDTLVAALQEALEAAKGDTKMDILEEEEEEEEGFVSELSLKRESSLGWEIVNMSGEVPAM